MTCACVLCVVTQGKLPSNKAKTVEVAAPLGGVAAASSSLSWTNPLARDSHVHVRLLCAEAPGIFQLLLPGAKHLCTARHDDAAGLQQDPALDSSDDDGQDGVDYSNRDDNDNVLQSVNCAQLRGLMMAENGVVQGSAEDINMQQQQRQELLPRVQVEAEVIVPPHGELQLPVEFRPSLLRDASAELQVELLEPALDTEPLVWTYKLLGRVHSDSGGLRFEMCAQARSVTEQTLVVPLPGLDVVALATALASAAASGSNVSSSSQGAGPDHLCCFFDHRLLLPAAQQAALGSALTLQRLDTLPAWQAGTAPPAPPCLRFLARFAPQRALSAKVQLEITSGSARWLYDLVLTVRQCGDDGQEELVVPCCWQFGVVFFWQGL